MIDLDEWEEDRATIELEVAGRQQERHANADEQWRKSPKVTVRDVSLAFLGFAEELHGLPSRQDQRIRKYFRSEHDPEQYRNPSRHELVSFLIEDREEKETLIEKSNEVYTLSRALRLPTDPAPLMKAVDLIASGDATEKSIRSTVRVIRQLALDMISTIDPELSMAEMEQQNRRFTLISTPEFELEKLHSTPRSLAKSIRERPGEPAKFHAEKLDVSEAHVRRLISNHLKPMGFRHVPNDGYFPPHQQT